MTIVRACVVALFILLLAQGGFAMIETLPNEELVINSELIAIAALKTSEKLPADAKGFVKVKNTLTLSLVMKGEAKTGEDLVVMSVDGMEDEPVFEPRKRYIVFLSKSADGAHYQAVNMIQGVWPLDSDEKPLGLGTGVTKAQLEQLIQKTKGQKPRPAAPVKPAF